MKTDIKTFLCCIGLASLVFTGNAQNSSVISLEASQNITNFWFKDSQGNRDKNYSADYSGGYALGYRYHWEQGMFFVAKLGMRKAGATYVFDDTNYSWNLQYAESRVGLGYNFSSPLSKFGFHVSAQGYFGYLLQANQRLNNEDFDILNSDALKKTDFGVFVSPGLNFTVSDFISLYIDLNYMIGLANLETDQSQKSKNTLMGATLGVAYTIK